MTGLALPWQGFVLVSLFLRHSILKGWAFVPQGGRLASHSTVIRWEQRLAQQAASGLPLHQKVLMSRLEGGRYTLVSVRTFPKASEGWTIHFIERESRYWMQAGEKETSLFEQGLKVPGTG